MLQNQLPTQRIFCNLVREESRMMMPSHGNWWDCQKTYVGRSPPKGSRKLRERPNWFGRQETESAENLCRQVTFLSFRRWPLKDCESSGNVLIGLAGKKKNRQKTYVGQFTSQRNWTEKLMPISMCSIRMIGRLVVGLVITGWRCRSSFPVKASKGDLQTFQWMMTLLIGLASPILGVAQHFQMIWISHSIPCCENIFVW